MKHEQAIHELACLTVRAAPVLCTFDLAPQTALTLHGLVRLALQHPDVQERMRDIGRQFCELIEAALRQYGASEELIEQLRGEGT